MAGKKIIVISGLLIAVSIPVTLSLIYQRTNTSSRAAAPDKLETEGGTLSTTGATKVSDSGASGGSYVSFSNIIASSPTPTSSTVPTSGPNSTPTSPPGSTYPPTTTLRYVSYPSISPPNYLASLTDPTFGTKVMRVNSVNGQRQIYSSIAAWNSDMSLLLLNYPPGGSGSQRAILNGSTYQVLQPTAGPPAGFTWANQNPNKGWGYSNPNRIHEVTINQSTNYAFSTVNTTTLSQYSAINLGGGQGSGSNNDRYLCVMFKKANNDHGVAVFDTTTRSVTSEVVLINSSAAIGDYPNNCGITQSGKYVFVGNSYNGTPVYQGGWVYDINLNTSTRRQITTHAFHWDAGLASNGEDVIVIVSQRNGGGANGSYAVAYKLDSKTNTNLISNWPNGHVSARNTKRPGWVYLSTFSTSGTFPGFGQVVAVNIDNPSQVQVFAHTHHSNDLGYASETHACASPDGARVIFASEWGGSTMNAYVAGMKL